MLDINTQTTQEEKDILSDKFTYFYMVQKLISHYTDIGKPFSSGEISAKLRTFRPDFVFSARNVGEMVRDYFTHGDLDLNRFHQFERISSTGQKVFVYAPNKWSGETYDFEVVVPPPTVQQILNKVYNFVQTVPKSQPVVVNLPTQPTTTPKTTDNTWTVRVSEDGRLRLRKGLVEALLNTLGQKDKLTFIRKSSASGLGVQFTSNGTEECKVERDGRVRIAGFDWATGKQFTVSLKDLL